MFVVHCLTQSMHNPGDPHLQAAMHILHYLKGCPSHESFIFTSYNDFHVPALGFLVFLGGSLITWKPKKQNVVSRYSVGLNIVRWLTKPSKWFGSPFTSRFGISCPLPMTLVWQSPSADTATLVIHDKTKQIDIDCHFIWEKNPIRTHTCHRYFYQSVPDTYWQVGHYNLYAPI